MHRHSRLQFLDLSASKHLDRLSRRAVSLRVNAPGYTPWQVEVEASAITIDLQNTWANACKWYVVSCMLGACTKSGARVTCFRGFQHEDDVIRFAITTLKPWIKIAASGNWRPSDEPAWHMPRPVLTLAAAAQLSNTVDLQNIFSAGFSVFDDLPMFRNYYAHRNRDTRARAMSLAPRYGGSVFSKPSEVLLSIPLNRPASVLEEWIDEVRLTLNSMCT